MNNNTLHHSTAIILTSLYNNKFTAESLLKDMRFSNIPTVNLGRGCGHTTAIQLFIQDKPDVTFAIYANTKKLFHDCYGQFKNCIYVGNRESYAGKRIDYVILENTSHMNTQKIRDIQNMLTDIMPRLSKNTPIIKIC